MSFRSFFQSPPSSNSVNHSQHKLFGEYLFDTFNWLYERSPVNFSSITGIYHPSIPRLMGNPFLGRALKVANANGLVKEIEELAKIAENDPKGRAYLSFGFDPNLLITKPEDIAQVFIHNYENIDRGEILEVFSKIFGDSNLFTLPHNETWKQKRHQLTNWIFSPETLSDLVNPMQEIVNQFIDEMKKKDGHIESLETFMVSLTMEVFAKSGLASKPLHDKTQKISDQFGKALDVISLPINNVFLRLDKTLKYFNLCASKHLDIERNTLQQALMDNFFELNKDNLLNQPNILQEYMKQYPNDPDAAFKNTCSDIGLLLLAGHETTSRLLQFVIVSLAENPAVLEKLRDEIAAQQPINDDWNYENITSLTYLSKVIKETLRLYPPVPVIPRRVTKTFILADIPLCKTKTEYEQAMKNRDQTKDVILHPGTNIDAAPWVTHKLAYLYEDPMRFNPDRYKTALVDSTDNFTWLPFGVDFRKCPGRNFAILETKLFLVKFLQKYDFEVICDGAKLGEAEMRGTLKHAGKLKLNIIPRNESSHSFRPF